MSQQEVRAANRFVQALLRKRDRPLLVAHRGASAFAPENTLDAAALGLASGADAWELDVRLTRDEVAIVIHDATLTRTTDVATRFRRDPRGESGYLVADFTADEIRTLDAGSWFVGNEAAPRSARWFGTADVLDPEARAIYSSGAVRIPTLHECLSWTAARDWLVNIEIKSCPGTSRQLVPTVLAEIESVAAADRILISSFDHHDVARVARCAAPIATGVLSSLRLHNPGRYVREIVEADCYHPSAEALGVNPIPSDPDAVVESVWSDDLRSLRDFSVPVLYYTVNDCRPGGWADRLDRAGIDALFTDDPLGMVRFFNSRKP